MENKKTKFQELILAELLKIGWRVDPRDNTKVAIARWAVKTFRGMDTAIIHPPVVCENGLVILHANFETKGENALSLCGAYFTTEEEVPEKIAAFHDDIMYWLSQAFSVRIGRPSACKAMACVPLAHPASGRMAA